MIHFITFVAVCILITTIIIARDTAKQQDTRQQDIKQQDINENERIEKKLNEICNILNFFKILIILYIGFEVIKVIFILNTTKIGINAINQLLQ